jgi:hypothetical protein
LLVLLGFAFSTMGILDCSLPYDEQYRDPSLFSFVNTVLISDNAKAYSKSLSGLNAENEVNSRSWSSRWGIQERRTYGVCKSVSQKHQISGLMSGSGTVSEKASTDRPVNNKRDL